ncbi:MAG: glycine cleavage system protein H [Bdellovibrio sp. CG10_big_fil_rev_8_21_14_0_10_47_8]|nr:MAG: glycine cleavage system protein H [Bdellovibrio sp. CG10_big_fil_rev_8_21_14_0_10_47_8]
MQKNFKSYMWFLKEDNVYTVGLNEDAIEKFDKIEAFDLPPEGETVDIETACGSLETDQDPIDLYSPVAGTVTEINSSVVEDPTLIQDDPMDSWLFKIESDDDYVELDDDDEDGDDDDDDEDSDDEDDDWDDGDEDEEED